MMTTRAANKKSLRKHYRALRASFSDPERQQADRDLCRRIRRNPAFLRAKQIALYLSNDGEAGLGELFSVIQRTGKQAYLPVIKANDQRLVFRRYQLGETIKLNRYRIPEPVTQPNFVATSLDLILFPLVAFDRTGCRLGMGGGYYDRTLNRDCWNRPYRIGIAYSIQEHGKLPNDPWDVKLNEIVTELETITIDT